MITFKDLKNNADLKDLIRRIDDIAFFLGSTSNRDNAIAYATFFCTLFNIKQCLIGNDALIDGVTDDILTMVYYLGCEMDNNNVDFVRESIDALYEVAKIIA